MNILLAVVGGATGAALVSGVFNLIQWKLNRKAKQEDTQQERSNAVCAARGLELQKIQDQMKVALLADRTILYDRIKHIGKSYIARGWVTVEELEDLNLMHSVYHDKDKLNGNGFLDNLMHTVNNTLEVRAK